MYYFMLITLLISTQGCESVQMSDYYVSIISGFQRWYYSGCVYLVTSDEPSMDSRMVFQRTVKSLSEGDIKVAQMTFKTVIGNAHNAFLCQQNQPLFVIIAGNVDVQKFLRSLSEVGPELILLSVIN